MCRSGDRSRVDGERQAGERSDIARKAAETKPLIHRRSRPAGHAPSRRALLALAALILLPAAEGHGQQVREARLLELGAGARGVLSRLQTGWLDWLGAYYQGDAERSASALESVLTDAQLLGMASLPDLATGAAASALEATRTGDLERAAKGIAAARRLHPRSPSVSYAEAAMARMRGEHLRSWLLSARGLIFELEVPTRRFVHLANLGLWGACTLLLLAAGFVALQMTVNGRRLLDDLLRFLCRLLPLPLAWILALIVLLWPLFLPGGLFLLVLYWSILIWGYTSRLEKLLLVTVWLGLAVGSQTVAWINGRSDLMLAPQVRGLEHAARGELTGSLYLDLQELPAILPESIDVKHLMADLHRGLGQLDRARPLYLAVLAAEPTNEAALVDLGVCYYHEGDLSRAIEHFRQAADGTSAAASFNLSQAYSELYRFAESEQALGVAQELARERVADWIWRAERQGAVSLDGGLRRHAEIRRQLAAAWIEPVVGTAELWQSLLGLLPSVLAFSGIAVAMSVLRRRLPKGSLPEPGKEPSSRWRALSLAMAPGRQSAESGRWLRAWIGLVPVAALLAWPLARGLGFRLPLRFTDAPWQAWPVAVVLLALYFGVRIVWRLR